jgi:hypothetical protein
MAALGDRLRPLVPATIAGWVYCGVYDKIRYYRNDVGNYFKLHFDAPIEKPWGEKSFYTCLINLNAGYEGGATAFVDARLPDGKWDNVPEVGRALLFEHEGWLHEGATVVNGQKYLISLNIFYKRYSQEELQASPPQLDCQLCGETTRVTSSQCSEHPLICVCGCYEKLMASRLYPACPYCPLPYGQ